jgi:subtilisin family serine protease
LLVSILKKAPNEVLVVGAAGNEDTMARQYPAAFSDAIAVAATGQNDGKAEYSNFGPWVDIAAPGGDATTGQQITSTMPGGLPGDKQGTSMAAPVVAGVAGLILAVDPGRSFQKLRSSLIKTADPRLYNADTAGGFNRQYYYPKVGGESSPRPLLGSGIVDAPAAIENTANTGRVVSNLGRVSRGCSVVASDSSPSAWAGPSSPAASAGPSSPAAWAGPSSPAAWAGPSSPAASGGVGDLFLLFLMLLAPVVISSHRIIKRRAGHSQWRR